MANPVWLGGLNGASAVAEIWKGTVTDTTAGHTYQLPVNDENGNSVTFSYTVTGGDTTVTILATSIATAWNASTDYRLTPVLASNVAGQLVLTARTAGTAFYIGTPAGTGSWTGTGVTTANVGGTDWNTAANWTPAVVPANSDTVTLDDNATADITMGLSQTSLTGITLNAKLGFTKSLGTTTNALKPGTGWTVNYGDTGNVAQPPAGSPLFRINFGSNPFTATVYATGSVTPTMTGRAAVQFQGGDNTSKLFIIGGARVDVAAGVSETASLTLIANSGPSSSLIVGSGTTLVTGDVSAGSTIFNCAMTTLSQSSSAQVTTQGSGAITTANIGGNAILNSTGTITTLNVYAGAVANFSGNIATKTVTTANLYRDGTIVTNSATPGHVTISTFNKLNGGTLKLTV